VNPNQAGITLMPRTKERWLLDCCRADNWRSCTWDLCQNIPVILALMIIFHRVVISIEDPFDQDDWDSWVELRKALPRNIQVVGDDLTVSNPKRVAMAAQILACDALLLKINQIGTISESLEA